MTIKIVFENCDDLEELNNNIDRTTTKASRVNLEISSLIAPIQKKLGKLTRKHYSKTRRRMTLTIE